MQVSDKLIKPLTEAKYLNADNVSRYRCIMRIFFEHYEKLKYWLYQEEVYEQMSADSLWADYKQEQCQQDLTALTAWGNLITTQDTRRVTTIEEFKNKKFSQLSREMKIKILGSHLSVLEFEEFENDNIEIELFKRYNRNTKPLEKHEMSMATFYSNTSLYITNFLNKCMETAEKEKDGFEARIIKIYNVTSDRKNKQRNHQELCIIFSILNNGPNVMLKDGVEIADKYLEEQSAKYKLGEENNLQSVKNEFNKFNRFMIELSKKVEYPFSSAIFRGEDKRSTKFHTGVSMVLATIFYYYDVNLSSTELLSDIRSIIKKSPLGDDTYNASSTNMRNVMNYLYNKNHIFDETYASLSLKKEISDEIKEIICK